jgi:3-hydroxyisobutyrate dehydrogenase-like beta-hydroxyacid dehydrogenase
MTTVGIVGVGLLGDAVASRLRAAGHAVVGYDVAPASMDRLAAMGGTPANGTFAQAYEAKFMQIPSDYSVGTYVAGLVL